MISTLIRGRRAPWLIKCVLVLLLLWPVWRVPCPPLQDYPNHLARAYIALHLRTSSPFAHYYTLIPYPIPNSLSDYLLIVLGTFMSLSLAGKLVLSLILIAFPLAYERFLLAARPKTAPIYAYWGWVLVYSHFFHRGYLNFLLGLILLFLSLAAYVRWLQRPAYGAWELATVLATLTYVAHLMAFGMLVLLVAMLLLYHRSSKRLVLHVVLSFFPAVLLWGIYWMGEHPPLTLAWYTQFGPWAVALLQAFFAYDPARDLLLIAPVLGLFVGLLFVSLLSEHRLNVWMASSALLFLLALVMPRGINILVRPGQRLLFTALLIAPAAFIDLRTLPGLFVRALLILTTVAVTLRVGVTYMSLQPDVEQVMTCVELLSPTVPTGHLVFLPYRGSVQPYEHIVEYVVIKKDAPVSNLFTQYSLLRTRVPLPGTRTLSDLNPETYPQAVIVGSASRPPVGYRLFRHEPLCTVWRSD